MSKFKIDDEVVCTIKDNKNYGKIGKVKFIECNYKLTISYEENPNLEIYWFVQNYELAEVFNSPLYRALTEEKLSNPKTKRSK